MQRKMKMEKVIAAALGGVTIFAACTYAQEASTQPGAEKPETWMDRDSLFIASADIVQRLSARQP